MTPERELAERLFNRANDKTFTREATIEMMEKSIKQFKDSEIAKFKQSLVE